MTRWQRFTVLLQPWPHCQPRVDMTALYVMRVRAPSVEGAKEAAIRRLAKEFEEAGRKVMTSDDLVVHSVFHGHVREAN